VKVDCRRVKLSKTISGRLFNPLGIAFSHSLQLAEALRLLATSTNLVDRPPQMAGWLKSDTLVPVTPMVDPNVEPGPQQVLVRQIGPVLAPLPK
jgi:hypothetical protein